MHVIDAQTRKAMKALYFVVKLIIKYSISAERKTSLGKNWHPNCLRCEECGKILAPGQHAEHRGMPYCHKPCYAARFGPKMMGYGSNVISHANFKREHGNRTLHNGDYDIDPTMVFMTGIIVHMQELLKKVASYNAHYEGKQRLALSTKEDNNNLIIEGPLRIYWGVLKPIQLKQFDNVQPTSQSNWRHSFVPGGKIPEVHDTSGLKSPTKEAPSSPFNKGFDDSVIFSPPEGVVMRRKNIKKFNTVAYRGDSRPNKWKRASINGHVYDFETRVFTPVLGSFTSVTVDSTMSANKVIGALLDKFKIENFADEYSLCMVSEKEGEKTLKDIDIPLLERIAVGPDDVSGFKIFLRDRADISPHINLPVPEETEEPKVEQSLPEEVEQLLDLPEPVLRGILRKFGEDEEKAVRRIKAKIRKSNT
ncbi:hypothetical protein KUTeg_010547 [Tegillarca granosa]|uniref:Uncharacterized protein n=1 Tax=Tegillarca granosa TaxID=220873 RepID=A0ABQ9F3B6_TEGGR|nr:hypothetical protein KUTeg_010547 [Tegillarca granosa]